MNDRPYRGERVADIAIVSIVAVPATAVGVVRAVAIRLTSPGPILFRQERVSRDGELFQAVKSAPCSRARTRSR